MSKTYRVSVIIPTYQRCGLLRNTLLFLARQTLSPEAFEVVVGIDGSTDGTLEMIASLDLPYRLVAHHQDNRGRASACNAAIHRAEGELLVLLDDDMEPIPSLLDEHLRAHHGRDGIGVLGAVPIRIEPDCSPVVQYVGTKFNRHLEMLARPGYQLQLRDFYSGNFSIPRDLMLEIGGFDEDFEVYGNEDLDLSLRLRDAGVSLIYSPDAVAFQCYTKDFAALARDTTAKGRTAVLLAHKHPEAFDDLKLGTYSHAPWPVRLIRDGLLRISEVWPAIPQGVMRLYSLLESRPGLALRSTYVHVLGYFYWLGARAALREHAELEPTNVPVALRELQR